MPLQATPTIKVRDLRIGDYLPSDLDSLSATERFTSGETVVARLAPAVRGKAKGQPRFTMENAKSGDQRERTFPDPDEEITVVRQVPTFEERQEYTVASRTFHRLTQVVEALHSVNRAMADVRSALADVEEHGVLFRASHGRSILRHYPADLEASAARYVALYEAYRPEIKALGVTKEQIEAWGQSRFGGVYDEGSLYAYSPQEPRNADCYADGTPAVHPDGPGTRYNVAPMQPEA